MIAREDAVVAAALDLAKNSKLARKIIERAASAATVAAASAPDHFSEHGPTAVDEDVPDVLPAMLHEELLSSIALGEWGQVEPAEADSEMPVAVAVSDDDVYRRRNDALASWSERASEHAFILCKRAEDLQTICLGRTANGPWDMSLMATTAAVADDGVMHTSVHLVAWWMPSARKGRLVKPELDDPMHYVWPTSALPEYSVREFGPGRSVVVHPAIGIQAKRSKANRVPIPKWVLTLKGMWETALGTVVSDEECSWCGKDLYEVLGPPITCALCQHSWHSLCTTSAAQCLENESERHVVKPRDLPPLAVSDWLPSIFYNKFTAPGLSSDVHVMCELCRTWIRPSGQGHSRVEVHCCLPPIPYLFCLFFPSPAPRVQRRNLSDPFCYYPSISFRSTYFVADLSSLFGHDIEPPVLSTDVVYCLPSVVVCSLRIGPPECCADGCIGSQLLIRDNIPRPIPTHGPSGL